MKQLYVLLFSILCAFSANAQSSGYWSTAEESDIILKGTRQIIPNKYRVVQLNVANFKNYIDNAPLEYSSSAKLTVDLPMPDGTVEQFAIVESPIMEEGLSAKFPLIKTYLGQGITNPRAVVRFGWTYKGFHAMVISEKGQIFIDPYSSDEREYYISYYKKDFTTNKSFTCHTATDDDIIDLDHNDTPLNGSTENSGDQLRTYRLALACTGEYTQFHGGTVADALSAMAVTMSRVNLIYETEVSIRMILIANNNQIIYLNSSTDPYTNTNGAAMLGQNQNTINSVIGAANYDIGHVFSTGGGGIASLRSPCNNTRKARGVTGQGSPVGDPFDVDYVAHEMGHQFGGNHTFNGTSGACSGNGSTATAYEPGSATTIMGYAGICPGQNIQNNSDAFFHTHNFDEIIAFSVNGNGNGCAVVTNTGNNEPNVSAGTGGYFIPASTPFELTGTATDPNGDPMTYSWEQFDLGPRGEPNSPTGNAPLFRSFEPKTIPSRTFPQISDIVNNTQTMGEILPSYSRGLEFRLTARDNKAGGGGVSYDGMSFQVTANAGPFLVTEPNTSAVTWTEGTPATINWDVANTDAAPVNCATVNIVLSIDGGFTYPITLATGVPNNGTATLIVPPGSATTMARVRVQCATNVFFDISNQNFSIVAPAAATYFLYNVIDEQTICAPNSASYSIDVLSLLNYSDDVNITALGVPSGVTLSFNNNPITPGNTLEVTATADETVATGSYPIEIKGSSTSGEESIFINLLVFAATPTTITPLTPEDGAVDASTKLTWSDANGAPHTYHLQVALEPTFNSLLVDETGITDNFYVLSNLQSYSVYYWRVKADNQCIQGTFSDIFTFRTATLDCQTYGSGSFRAIISSVALTYSSVLEITDDVSIVDLNVKNLQGAHSRISDLSFTLESPSGTQVELFSRICSDQDNFNINLDDEAANDNYPCPPTNGGTYQAQGQLGTFNDENSAGTWTMFVEDHEAGEGGSLSNWELEICKSSINPNADPIIIKNEPLEITKGSSRNISNELLLSTDADNSAADLRYTLIETTSEGTLELDGRALSVGSTFTQSEIDAATLSYQHNIDAGTSDAFRFHVDDGQGGWAGSPNFTINIVDDINRFNLEDGEVWIYPNPTSDVLNISLRLATPEAVSFMVYDAIGQLVMKGTLVDGVEGSNELQLDTNPLTNGVYALVIEGETFSITEKIVISK